MRAMILAAGRGQRMGSLTEDRPKPLVRLAGRALIEYPLEQLIQAGIREFVVNLGYRGDQIRQHLGDGSRWGVWIQYSDEGESTLETGGGIANALPLLGTGPFLIVNADVHAQYDMRPLIARSGCWPASDRAHLVLVPNPSQHPRGDFAIHHDRVVEPIPAGAATYTYAGLAILSAALFDGQARGRFPLAPLLRRAAAAGTVSAEVFTGAWCDVGTPERLSELQQRIDREGDGAASA